MKKILIFSTAYFPFVGGAEVAVKEITNRLSEIDFDLITARIGKLPKEESVGNVHIYRVGFGIKFDKFLLPVLGYMKAVQLQKLKNYDVVWSVLASQASVASAFFKKRFSALNYY